MKLIQLLTTFVLLLATLFPTQAKRIIVPKDFDEIQAAVDKAGGGDTVFLTKGVYEEFVTMRDSVMLMGEDIRGTVIHWTGNQPVVHAADFARIQNLTVKGGKTGILCDNKRFAIDHVFVTESDQTGIHCLISLPVIKNCIITRNKWTGIFCESVISIRGGFEHNVVAENGYCGIMLSGKSNLLVANNVVCNNRQFGIWVSQDSKKTRIVHNCIFGNRNAFNSFAVVNNSNVPDDPGYAPMVPNTYDYFIFDMPHLGGKGTDDGMIGLTTEGNEQAKEPIPAPPDTSVILKR